MQGHVLISIALSKALYVRPNLRVPLICRATSSTWAMVCWLEPLRIMLAISSRWPDKYATMRLSLCDIAGMPCPVQRHTCLPFCVMWQHKRALESNIRTLLPMSAAWWLLHSSVAMDAERCKAAKLQEWRGVAECLRVWPHQCPIARRHFEKTTQSDNRSRLY
ncbi:unnamed protein product [Ostreobium quekettii]|uniref:Uncharacterized protein n=1 Tax=Ostreobium quekettii TaxID=121088 RepID=A0A8S1JFS1_9CHLO|nr:unnamed protein product [Ostreobium quekettii]